MYLCCCNLCDDGFEYKIGDTYKGKNAEQLLLKGYVKMAEGEMEVELEPKKKKRGRPPKAKDE